MVLLGCFCCRSFSYSLMGDDDKDLSVFSLFFPTGKEASGHSQTHDVEEIER